MIDTASPTEVVGLGQSGRPTTVHAGRECRSLEDLHAFVARLPFPEHALVLRPRQVPSYGDTLHKGITRLDALERLARPLLAEQGSLWVEVDLRAHRNPTRMGVIQRAGREFAAELATPCPACGAAWFRVVEHLAGLPCSDCGLPTPTTLALRRSCDPCGCAREEPRPDGRRHELPASCPACNP